MELSPEDKKRIYEEEKVRVEAREKITKAKKGIGCGTSAVVIIAVVFIIALVSFFVMPSNKTNKAKTSSVIPSQTSEKTDKSQQIANWIQEKVNTGGYHGCQAHSIGYQVVKCEMHFPAGTSRLTVEANTQGVADMFAQAGRLTSTIYYTGYSGAQKVCEFKYDMYSGTVDRVK